MEKLRLGILGTGFLGGIIADAWMAGLLDEYELVGVVGRNPDTLAKMAEKTGCRPCRNLDELLELKPDYVAEAASVQAVKNSAEKILSSQCGLVVLSIGAFADTDFYERMKQTAKTHGTKIYIASGAIGGFDVLRTVSLMGEAKSGITSCNSPAALKNTPLFEDYLMTDEQKRQVFAGNAKEAIALLPARVNVAVATSLATTGPENTRVNIFSVPGMTGDDHRIVSETDDVRAIIDIYSSTSAIAGWSVVAVLRNIVSPVVF